MSKVTIGLDLGDRFSHLAVLDSEGTVTEETRIPTTAPAMRRWFSRVGQARVALEVGTHSRWVSRLLEELGHEVIVAVLLHHLWVTAEVYEPLRNSHRIRSAA